MTIAICWDLDGVIVHARPLEEHGCHPDAIRLYAILQAGHPLWLACLAGEQDTQVAMLQLAHEHGVAAEHYHHLMNVWQTDLQIDTRVLGLMQKSKQAGAYIAIASNQDSLRALNLRNLPQFQGLVDVWGFSCDIGSAKPHDEFYKGLLDRLPVKVGKIVFIDDLENNLSVPLRLGWHTHQYTSIKSLDKFITELLMETEI